MRPATRLLSLPLLAAVGSVFTFGPSSAPLATERTWRAAPLCAIYRLRATPELAQDAPAWVFTRSGERSFAGLDPSCPSSSALHGALMAELARSCAMGGDLVASSAEAQAFEHTFRRHAPRVIPDGVDGVEEVWWSDELALPLVIVRRSGGRTLVDELVHLQFEERAELLAR